MDFLFDPVPKECTIQFKLDAMTQPLAYCRNYKQSQVLADDTKLSHRTQ